MSRQPTSPPTEPIERVADLVAGIPGVAGLSAGEFAAIATYLPSGRLHGVRQLQGRTEVGVVLEWGASAVSVIRLIRARVEAVTGGPVDVTLVDVALPTGMADLDQGSVVPVEEPGSPDETIVAGGPA